MSDKFEPIGSLITTTFGFFFSSSLLVAFFFSSLASSFLLSLSSFLGRGVSGSFVSSGSS